VRQIQDQPESGPVLDLLIQRVRDHSDNYAEVSIVPVGLNFGGLAVEAGSCLGISIGIHFDCIGADCGPLKGSRTDS
jgi:hypothetical protein